MTDQKKIPLPPENKKSRKSLFEQAEDTFGLKKLKAAPVPEKLAEGRVKRPQGVQHQKPADSEQAASAPAAPPPPRPLSFSRKRQPINRELLLEDGMIVPGGPTTTLLEEFRIVKREVLRKVRENERQGLSAAAQRVLVCSPLPNEGKTFCATNLALAIAAEKDSEVLLVDADFAKPSILSTLGLTSSGPGLMDALANPLIRVEDCILATDVPGLWVLPAGNQSSADSEYLSSNKTAALLDQLTAGAPHRMIIFDSPPALVASPAAELAKYVGQALVVVRADKTGQSALEDALSLLSHCPDVKLLLNGANFSPSGRRFGSYYGYEG
ncbi:capsular biosynthesis protein [Altericroceibacterium spongiae]|uniref:Capsular biosynthesis protein n=1 Tax=Altericroceibacterium spongiae TaxID=2320269 RepID=A0A420ERH3_9SPHN|nr:capsular biosynthesis protein [Altericroceibacterium spongiae]RKF23240.1 capsular biosynthesis protein [Altericroceibacterium spongiae]